MTDDQSQLIRTQMTLPPTEPGKQPASAGPPISETLKFSTKRLVLAFAIAGISDAFGAFATPVPPIVWVVDIGTALLLFLVLGRQWLLLPGSDPGPGGASIVAAGGRGDCRAGYSSAEFWTAVTDCTTQILLSKTETPYVPIKSGSLR
jgi:hypothetical protein